MFLKLNLKERSWIMAGSSKVLGDKEVGVLHKLQSQSIGQEGSRREEK